MANIQKITGKRGSSYRVQFMKNGRRIGQIFKMHIPADHEHRFRFNVNTISGPM